MSKTAKLLILLIFATVTVTYGQQAKLKEGDYIVTIQNDTLNGEVRFKNDTLLLFKNAAAANIKYTPDKLKAAQADGNSFTVKQVLGRSKFLQEVVTGYLSLYRFQSVKAGERFFLGRNDTIFVVTPKNIHGIIGFYLKDCPQEKDISVEVIKKLYKYNLKDLISFVSYYNLCKGYQDEQVIKYSPEKTHFKTALSIGLESYRLKLGDKNEDYPGLDFGNKASFVAAMAVSLGKETGFSVRSGLQFTHKEGAAKSLPYPLNNSTSVDVDFSASFLEAPLLFRYTFAGKGIRPYVSFGPHAGVALQSNIQRTPHGFTYTDSYEQKASKLGLSYGVVGNAGVYFPQVFKGMEVEIRADKSNYEHGYDLSDLQSASLQLLVGFYLNK
ncbi:outer membrane beta-barrel protein [Pontibacter liquoris]|uniref:outer membrane beta-barrel protein n=1 Tax=Pontibacter liquoris TaxID=2905677 RepID=UPI001FA6C4BB|nr:outer membrane beta-barrel protein [Pontibacter liquoris]